MSKVLVNKTPSEGFTLNWTEINQNFQCAIVLKMTIDFQYQALHFQNMFSIFVNLGILAIREIL